MFAKKIAILSEEMCRGCFNLTMEMGKLYMKRIIRNGAILFGSLISLNTIAQDLSAEDAQDAFNTRHAVFELLAFSNAPLGVMARGGEFDQEAAVQAAERVALLAGLIPDTFNVDTSGVEIEGTRSATTIWQNKADFDQLAMDLQAGAEAAAEILRNDGAAGVRNAVAQIGPKCGACHDRFRLD